MTDPIKDLIAQGGLGLLAAISLWANIKMVGWIRDLYEKHSSKLEALILEQQKSAEQSRSVQTANAAALEKTSGSVDRLSATVQTQGQLLASAAIGRRATPAAFPAVRDTIGTEGKGGG